MGFTVTARPSGHSRKRSDRARRAAARESLLAAGVAPAPMLPTYDMLYGSPGGRYWNDQVLAAGHENIARDSWPCESEMLDVTEAEFREGPTAVFRTPEGSLVKVSLSDGWMSVSVAAPDPSLIPGVFASLRSAYPASYLTATDDLQVPITFWANSPHGPIARLRRIESAAWTGLDGNYTAPVAENLDALFSWESGPPSADGQLILWQGPPGTGKSWALRALASEWAPWAEFHYITDPDAFFVDDPSYMINVLLADSYSAIDEPTGDVYSEQGEGKWRILILEDTGELLSANAKEKYGQGLSRLLNVVDGMIGQGLKVLALVTTNDELGDLHPAVTRPGRCAMQIEFGPLTDKEAQEWTGDPDATSGTLAELYARRGTPTAEALPADEATDELTASAADDEIVAAIREVAAAHQEDAVGYGETAWLADEAAVLYVGGDWTDTDPIEADFLAIDGVEEFRHEAEELPDGWWDAEVVYPDDPPRWVVEPPEESALADIVALALEPLLADGDREAEALLAALRARPTAPAQKTESRAIERALEVLASSHERTVEGVATVLASAAREDAAGHDDSFAMRALDVFEAFARRPHPVAPAAAPVHVHVPEREMHLTVEASPITVEAAAPAPIHIDVPAQPPPVVHVAAAEAPVVHAPVAVTVEAAQAPDVHVDVHPPAAEPRARAVRVEVDADGTKRYVIEGEEEE